jgi:isopentenyldiphosphate isomerase
MFQEEEEWLPLVDEKGMIIGKELRSVCHTDKKYLHPVVHLHVFNNKGELFLQKRPMFKKVQPGKWDTAVGGHISLNDNIETGLQREAKEELGLINLNAKLAGNYIWESEIEREYVHCFITEYNDVITFNKEEIADGRFWSTKEIEENIGKGSFTPNFEKEYTDILSSIQKK